MSYSLLVVTGAPGSGKSTAVEQLLTLEHGFTVFDIDWLIDQGSELIGKRMQEAPASWKPWAHLWFEVLHSVLRNGQIPIFFCPNSKQDFEDYGLPDWCEEVHWLLLDCEDSQRAERLKRRDWSDDVISSCIDDADELRQLGFYRIDTAVCSELEVAQKVVEWANQKSDKR